VVSADPRDFRQLPDALNASETRLERLNRLSELGQPVLMNSAIEIIVTPIDRLERLETLSRQALPVDRLRIERTIRIIRKARHAVTAAHRVQQESSERLRLARNSAWRTRAALLGYPGAR
jgi:hypothetical protein